MAYWWVNQNKTWRQELAGGYLWSPKRNANGRRSQYYDNMELMLPGDVVLSYYQQAIRSIGIVQESAASSPKPDFGGAGANWDESGWEVLARFVDAPVSVRPQDHLELFNQTSGDRYAPMNSLGNVNTFYLFALNPNFAQILIAASGIDLASVQHDSVIDIESIRVIEEAESALNDDSLTRTMRRQLGYARVGQGLFKNRVEHYEKSCRLTGLSESRYLIASHIKPWRDSDNRERLDGENGLLLSPHVDYLFDRGLITFSDDGNVMESPNLLPVVQRSWRLDFGTSTGAFSKGQRSYLEHHRELVFKAD